VEESDSLELEDHLTIASTVTSLLPENQSAHRTVVFASRTFACVARSVVFCQRTTRARVTFSFWRISLRLRDLFARIAGGVWAHVVSRPKAICQAEGAAAALRVAAEGAAGQDGE
jgi:hypothetical protein